MKLINGIFGKFLAFYVVVFLVFSASAHAATCYDQAQAEAEAAIRIHSEMMVTALTCQYSHTTGANLTDVYNAFGTTHNAALKNAEKTLMNYYQKKSGSGVNGLDKLRTVLGNQYAEAIAKQDPKTYCANKEDMVSAAGLWTPQQFEQAVQVVAKASSASEPLCSKVAAK